MKPNYRFEKACDKALNSFPEKGYWKLQEIKTVILPYRAVDAVINELIQEGFIKRAYLDTYELTPLGFENMDHYDRKIQRMEKEIFDYKYEKIRSFILSLISVAAFVLSLIALFR